MWDDNEHITRPELQSLAGLRRIWIDPSSTWQYYPAAQRLLDRTSAVGRGAAGLSPGQHRHARAGGPVGGVGLATAGDSGGLAGRRAVRLASGAGGQCGLDLGNAKNTLSTVFYLAAAWAYLGFDQSRRPCAYFLALGLFLAGLMSKSVVATLPGGILVALWWQRGRLSWKADVLPVVPFFLIGAGAGMVTAWWELAMNGCRGPEFVFTSVQRLFIAGHSLWFELGKLFWPVNLTFIYPRWEIGTHALRPYLYPLGWAAPVLGLWLLRRYSRAPRPPAVLLRHARAGTGLLQPVYLQVCLHGRPLPVPGLPGHLHLVGRRGRRSVPPPDAAPTGDRQGMVAALVLLLAVLTWRQARIYADNETLFALLSSGIPRALWPTIIWPWPCSRRTQRRSALPSATGRGPEARRGREPQQPRPPVGQPRADRRGHCPVRGRAGDRPRQRRGPLPPGQSAGQAGPVGRGHRRLPGGLQASRRPRRKAWVPREISA